MPKSRRRRWIRLALVLVGLVAVVLAAFTWLAFWPLEGSVAQLASLVPDKVDFVYRGSWKGLKHTHWLQQNIMEHPIVPQVRDALGSIHDMLGRLEENEQQINDAIPLGITHFSVENDLLGREFIAAGRFCEGWDPSRGLPRWRELLFLTRISWKTRFFSALKHGFVRNRLGPNVTVTDEGNGVFRFVLDPSIVRPGTLQERSGCGPGIVVPPMNVWFVRRVKDVLAVTNSQDLMQDVGYLVDFPDSGRSYLDRPWVRLDAPPNTVAASVDLQPLEHYLARTLEMAGSPYTILRRYLTVTALDRMNGRLVFPSTDLVLGKADIKILPSQLGPGVADVYALPPTDLAKEAATLLPAEDTFGVLLLRTPPLHLIEGIFEEILSPGDRKLWQTNATRMGYRDIHAFFQEFATNLSDTALIAVGRLSDPFDHVEWSSFYTHDLEKHPNPMFPALTIAIRLSQSATPAQLDAYLAQKMPLLGASPDLEKVEYRGLTYTRAHLQVTPADYALVEPAYILAQNYFIYCSNETYFRKLLDTIADPRGHPSLAADRTFKNTMEQLDETSQLTFFLDLSKLFAVPEKSGKGEGPRGFLWDQRNAWVIAHRSGDKDAERFRNDRIAELTRRQGSPPSPQQMAEIYDQEQHFVDDWHARYPEFEEEYRRQLAAYGALQSFGASIHADRRALHLSAALLLKHPQDESKTP